MHNIDTQNEKPIFWKIGVYEDKNDRNSMENYELCTQEYLITIMIIIFGILGIDYFEVYSHI